MGLEMNLHRAKSYFLRTVLTSCDNDFSAWNCAIVLQACINGSIYNALHLIRAGLASSWSMLPLPHCLFIAHYDNIILLQFEILFTICIVASLPLLSQTPNIQLFTSDSLLYIV